MSLVGILPRCSLAKRKSSRKVSRYPAIVFALASICVQSWSVKKRWSSAGKVEAVIGAFPLPKSSDPPRTSSSSSGTASMYQ